MTPRFATVTGGASIREAVERMYREGVSALVVCEGGRLQGLVIERDLALRAGRDDPTVADLLGPHEPLVCRDDQLVADALTMFKQHRVSAVPVVTPEGAVAGVLSAVEIAA
ncbi:MAG TPA: CBS domain-containing protein, partial [Nitrospira sp.]|nr:CBS domain-containing protein [Nitrospira sp.]